MTAFLYKFFHNETNDRTEKGSVVVPEDKNLWPISWKTVFYKEYLNFKSISLPHVKGVLLESFLNERTSKKEELAFPQVTFEAIAYILQCGYGLQTKDVARKEHRTVPSAGGRYPLEIYVIVVKATKDLSSGVYHYNVRTHMLEPVFYREFSQDGITKMSSSSILLETSYIICITSVFHRTTEKYGSRGYRYILLEAGHVAQNMLLAGFEKKTVGIPLGGINDVEVEKVLGLTSQEERLVYVLCF